MARPRNDQKPRRATLKRLSPNVRREVLDRLSAGETAQKVAEWLADEHGVSYTASSVSGFGTNWLPAAQAMRDMEMWASIHTGHDTDGLKQGALIELAQASVLQILAYLSSQTSSYTPDTPPNVVGGHLSLLHQASVTIANLARSSALLDKVQMPDEPVEGTERRKVDEEFLRHLADDVLGLLR